MIKKIMIVILLVSMLFLLCGCDDVTKETYTKAYIKTNEKTIVVDVKEYGSHSNGVVVIHDTDGKIYKTHFTNVVLVKDTEGR